MSQSVLSHREPYHLSHIFCLPNDKMTSLQALALEQSQLGADVKFWAGMHHVEVKMDQDYST